MKNKTWVQVNEGKITIGPVVLSENYFSKKEKNSEVSQMTVVNSGWLPVYDNSIDVDMKKFAVSADYKIEIFPDRVLKTHKIKEFPPEFIEAFNNRLNILRDASK